MQEQDQDQDTDDSPWDDDAPSSSTTPAHAEAEWTRLSSAFQNVRPPSPLSPVPTPGLIATNQPQAGYRDGITAGKDGALQQGFDAGFAQAGAPRGRELGILRGLASALLLHLSRAQAQAQTQAQSQTAIEEEEQEQAAIPAVREIVDALAAVRFADIAPAPPPDEAEHTHGADEAKCEGGGAEEGEARRRSSTGLGPSAGSTTTTIEDVRALRVRLEALLRKSGLNVNLNLESPAS